MASPLAFVLWHSPAAAATLARYEETLKAFHAALRENPPEGFIRSECLRFEALPWLETSRAAYQDWYVTTDFTSLGILNDAAVAGSRRKAHDETSALSAQGIGGLYALEAGEAFPSDRMAFHWLQKPAEVLTSAYLSDLRHVAENGASLWRRQLNLGVAPEYCLRCPVERELPGCIYLMQPDRIIWEG